jgi:hypothetical protein
MTATAKQVAYALSLIGKAGYNTRYMDASFRALGAGMRERSGTVEAWLSRMSRPEISKLIDELR